jgi:hypothetical protein
MPIETIVLLGWMDKPDALSFLMNDCVFPEPLTEAQATAHWEDYRHRVETLPDRPVPNPKRKRLKPEESNWERQFLQFSRANGANVRSVIKVNLMDLVVHQLRILTARSADYAKKLTNQQQWNRLCLPNEPDTYQINWQFKTTGLKTEVEIPVPHQEWLILPVVEKNTNALFFKPAPAMKYVTAISPQDDRTVLWAGYHRSYAWAAANVQGEAMDCPALVAFAENVVADPIDGNLSLFDRLVRGPRPPLFRDFFDESLFMRVNLKNKRFLMKITSDVIPIDDP